MILPNHSCTQGVQILLIATRNKANTCTSKSDNLYEISPPRLICQHASDDTRGQLPSSLRSVLSQHGLRPQPLLCLRKAVPYLVWHPVYFWQKPWSSQVQKEKPVLLPGTHLLHLDVLSDASSPCSLKLLRNAIFFTSVSHSPCIYQ